MKRMLHESLIVPVLKPYQHCCLTITLKIPGTKAMLLCIASWCSVEWLSLFRSFKLEIRWLKGPKKAPKTEAKMHLIFLQMKNHFPSVSRADKNSNISYMPL